jgi:hypothetical protein
MLIKPDKVMKMIARKSINNILEQYGKLLSKNYDIANTIVIAGVPRGGTTWLYEILLNSIPQSCGIWEPLALYTNARLTKLNFSWREYIDPTKEWKEAEMFFRDILIGANMSLSLIHNYSLFNFFRTISKSDTYIVKFCRANRLLKWMVEKTGITSPILLIRHPCAVVASQLSHGAWDHVKENNNFEHPAINRQQLKKEPWIKEIIRHINTPEEKLAITWCLDFYIPLSEPKPHPWILTSYEKLVTDGENEITRIFKSLSREVPKEVALYLKKPSTSTKVDSNVAMGRNRLDAWKKRLNEDQQEKILSLVSKFGLDFYTDSLEPDYERLYKNPIRHIGNNFIKNTI